MFVWIYPNRKTRDISASRKKSHSTGNSFCLLLALLAGFIVCNLGCQRNRPNFSAPVPSSTIAKTVNQLPTISIDSRQFISHTELQGIAGSPVVEDYSTVVRTVGFSEIQSMAADNSTIANAIDGEREKLCCREDAPKCLATILNLQAQHERNQSAGQAGEAFLNLVQVYLLHDVLLESTREVDRASKIVQKLKDNDVPIDFDERQLVRQENELEEKAAELLFNQKRLTTGLSLLMDLDVKDTTPIWTVYQSQGLPPTVDLQSALDTAWSNRADLQAMSLLTECCDADLLDIIRSSAKSLHPLLGLAIKKKRWLRRPRLSKIEDTQEACCRVNQIKQLMEARKKLIAREIADLVFSMQKRRRLIGLKKETITSLEQSISSAEKAVEIKPIDLKTQLANRARVYEIRAELIREIIGLEIDSLKLKQAQGLLAPQR